MLDLEVTGGLGPTALTNWTKAWLQRVDERIGAKAIIYTSPSFWRSDLNNSRWFADNGYAILWVAHWGVSSPSVPAEQLGRPILDVLAVHEQRDGPGDLRPGRPQPLPLLDVRRRSTDGQPSMRWLRARTRSGAEGRPFCPPGGPRATGVRPRGDRRGAPRRRALDRAEDPAAVRWRIRTTVSTSSGRTAPQEKRRSGS